MDQTLPHPCIHRFSAQSALFGNAVGGGLLGEGVVWGLLLALVGSVLAGPSCPHRAGAGVASGASLLLNFQL